jgi:hypothetical protein
MLAASTERAAPPAVKWTEALDDVIVRVIAIRLGRRPVRKRAMNRGVSRGRQRGRLESRIIPQIRG